MGEAKRRQESVKQEVVEALGLETAGGHLQVRWDNTAQATPHGQMAFFIFLTLSELFEGWVADCPLVYTSPNGSSSRAVVGTWLLSILKQRSHRALDMPATTIPFSQLPVQPKRKKRPQTPTN